MLLAALILTFDLSLPLGVAGGVPYVALVCLGWYARGPRDIIVLGVVSTLLTVAGYIYSPDGGTAWVVLVNRFLAFVAIWVTAAFLIVAKQAGKKVEASQKRLSALLALAPQAVVSVDEDQRIRLFNKGAEAIFGYSAREVQGQPIHMLLPARYRDETARQLTKLGSASAAPRAMGTPRKVVGLRKDGSEFPAKGAVSRLDLAGETAFTVIIYDCTEEQEAQQRIVELARFPDEDPSPVLRVEPGGTVRYANRAARGVAELFAGDGPDRLAGGLLKEVAHAFEAGRPHETDFVAGDCTLSLRFSPVASEPYLNLYARDITLRKKAEAALRKANQTLEQRVKKRAAEYEAANLVLQAEITERKRAERALARSSEDLKTARDEADAANRAKSEFLASMSHELRTPLNAVIGFSEIIKDETFGPVGSAKYRDYGKDIHESGQHLLYLINDILDLSKVESGTEELHEANIDVPEIVRCVRRLVAHRAEQGSVRLEIELPDQPAALRADEHKLKQILVNLLSNAVKFTNADGNVTLRAWCRKDCGYVFQITDDGIGMAPGEIPKALARFGQVDSALSRRHEGTGLGLPLTKALVELHGGSLDLQSEVGVGTTATVRFPAARIVARNWGKMGARRLSCVPDARPQELISARR